MPDASSPPRAAAETGIRVLFVAGFGPIVREEEPSRTLYRDVLGLEFEDAGGGYLHTERLEGAKSFGLWPLSHAAQSCFGTERWPAELPVPQAWWEFDVEDVANASATLQARGYRLLVSNRTEPWGQTVTRLLSPEGVLVGVTRTPWMRAAGAAESAAGSGGASP